MRLLAPILAILAAASAVIADGDKVKIDVTYLPEDCTVTAANGDTLNVHYTGKLTNGNKFDSSYDRGTPLPVTLGAHQVITGWEEGLQGMCKGEKRTLTIPSTKAYGSRGFGNIIPAHSTLIFDVELDGLKKKKGSHQEL